MSRPPLLDLDYAAACEAAAKALREAIDDRDAVTACISYGDPVASVDYETLAAAAVDAVLTVLEGCGDYSTWWGCHCTRTGEHDQHRCRCGTTWKGEGK